jgi:hypothetical protein
VLPALFARPYPIKSAVEPQHPSAKRERLNTRSRRASDLVILFGLSQPKLPNFILTRKEAAAKPPEVCSVSLHMRAGARFER